MALYSSFTTSQYYDEPVKAKAQETQKEYIKPHEPKLSEEKKKSLYEEAKQIAETHKYVGPDFREIYRVGQEVAIQGPKGNIRTRKGRIAEIVARDLMYVWMEDTYTDVNGNFMADFVTGEDIITRI